MVWFHRISLLKISKYYNRGVTLRNNVISAIWRQKRIVCLFAFYAFVFLLTEINVNIRAGELWGSSAVTGVYAIGLLCTGSGYLSYNWAQMRFGSESSRKAILLGNGLLAMVSQYLLLLGPETIAVYSGWVALFAMGFLAAAIYYYTACALSGSKTMGRLVGVGMFLAVLLQYAAMHIGSGKLVTCGVLVLAGLGICHLVWQPPADWCFENPLPYEKNPPDWPKTGLLAMAMVGLMTFGFGFSDECVTALDARGELDVAAWPRLFYGLGLLLSGWLVDLDKRRHIYTITAVAFSLSLLSPALLVPKLYNASLSIMYLYSGFYVMFLTTAFLELAPRTSRPWLWAGMGRIVRSFTTAAVIVPAELVMEHFDILGVIGANVVAAMGVFLLSWYAKEEQRRLDTSLLQEQSSAQISSLSRESQAQLQSTREQLRQAAKEKETAAQERLRQAQMIAGRALQELEEARSTLENLQSHVQELERQQSSAPDLEAFAKLHELTPREKDVLTLILTRDGTTKELAKELLISERVCQRYLTSIYDKTGCNSKVGLILLFYGAKHD